MSSLFKKNKNYLGIYKFKALSKLTDNDIVALGGISRISLKTLQNIRIIGFAGISFFE